MKNLPTLKNNKLDSPKTPGGISKSLLTPCRRVGLSRNWRKSGPSPFISPLSGNVVEVSGGEKETRKRKELSDEHVCGTVSTITNENESISSKTCENTKERSSVCNVMDTTPSRNVSLPRRKKSRTMVISRIQNTTEESPAICSLVHPVLEENINNSLDVNLVSQSIVATPGTVKSVEKTKKLSCNTVETSPKIDLGKENLKGYTEVVCKENTAKPKSPENLTKECIVVIQKKIFKNALEPSMESKNNGQEAVSQALFDSDTDDVPLSVLNMQKEKETNKNLQQEIIVLDDESDFIENTKVKVIKLKDKTTSTGGLKSKPNVKKKVKEKYEIVCPKASTSIESKVTSQTSFDDDEDFVMNNKRTIIIRKSYDKVSKPYKAKSTGSITQQDIDELKARIDMKKKLLLAKATGTDTEELRTLIKKWQKGCQEALIELMDLMKIKCQDKKDMDYSQILATLKIPADLVGYDEENDCFATPTDESIVLSKFNDL